MNELFSSLLSQYSDFLSNGGLIPYAAKGLEYLRRAALGDPPTTSPISLPYTPPFTGGQCAEVVYTATILYTRDDDSTFTNPVNVAGAITGTFKSSDGANWRLGGRGGSYSVNLGSTSGIKSTSVQSIVVAGGGDPNACGDPPDTRPSPDISVDGLADSAAPDLLTGASPIITGSPLPDDGMGSLASGSESDFTDAGALAPSDIAGALAKLAAGLAKIANFLSLLNEILDLLKKLFSKDNKSSFSYDFGNLSKDGFIKLLSEPPPTKTQCLFVDLQVTEVKPGIGKIFGKKSPNYYAYEPIGRLYFVSRTFGVLSVEEIRFVRTSIPCPALAYGFFYNFGLDGVNKANCSGFYLKEEE